MIACSSTTVDFSFSPEQPRAGESVTFSNLSSGGEDWEWSFGDGGSSIVKNPTKIYRQPGRYIVSLRVDGKSKLTCTKEITIYDTIPNYSCSKEYADSLGLNIFEDVTFTAEVYNPFKYAVTYEWLVPAGSSCIPVSSSNTESTWKVYFERPNCTETVLLMVIMNGDTTLVTHTYTINDVAATALLIETDKDEHFRRRVYGNRAEALQPFTYPEGITLLKNEQDTFQHYNGHTYYLSELIQDLPNLIGFKLVSLKIYARTNFGLCVANLPDANNLVMIDGRVPSALTIDVVNNRFYWANEDGIYYMPLINSSNNQYTTTPTYFDSLSNVVKLVIDTIAR